MTPSSRRRTLDWAPLSDYGKELERRDVLAAAHGHASDAARLADAPFDAGQVSFLDVLQADIALADAEMALARSQARAAVHRPARVRAASS